VRSIFRKKKIRRRNNMGISVNTIGINEHTGRECMVVDLFNGQHFTWLIVEDSETHELSIIGYDSLLKWRN
jgi:hypothetical protein